MVELQFKLTAIPALSPDNGGDGEYQKSRLLRSFLEQAGFSRIWEINAPDARVSSGIRPNLMTLLPGKDQTKTVWILTHMDVVPPGELKSWSEDPYHGYVKDGKVFGRGTEDNQQDLVASLFAARAFLAEGLIPERNIGLAFVSDEETSSEAGLSYVLDHEENPFTRSDIIIVPDAGDDKGSFIEIAEKSILWLKISTTGRQCHASKPALGNNAFVAASHLVVRLNDLHRIFHEEDPLYDPPASTFQPTKKESNVPNVNTIPGFDAFYLDCRVLPRYPLQEVLAAITAMAREVEDRFAVSIAIEPVQQVEAPPPTSTDAPVVAALQEAVKEVYQLEAHPAGIGGGTVAACFRKRGYPAAVWCRAMQTAHQPDEYCSIENMVGNAKVYAHVFLQHNL